MGILLCSCTSFQQDNLSENNEEIELDVLDRSSAHTIHSSNQNEEGYITKKKTGIGFLCLIFKESTTRKVIFVFTMCAGIYFIWMKLGLHIQSQEYKRMVEICNEKMINDQKTCYLEFKDNLVRMGIVKYNELFVNRSVSNETKGYLCSLELNNFSENYNEENHDIVKELSRLVVERIFEPIDRYASSKYSMECAVRPTKEEIERASKTISFFAYLKKNILQGTIGQLIKNISNRTKTPESKSLVETC